MAYQPPNTVSKSLPKTTTPKAEPEPESDPIYADVTLRVSREEMLRLRIVLRDEFNQKAMEAVLDSGIYNPDQTAEPTETTQNTAESDKPQSKNDDVNSDYGYGWSSF